MVVTGGAGFIGSNFVHFVLRRSDYRVVVVDNLTYAGNLQNLKGAATDPRFIFVRADIADCGLRSYEALKTFVQDRPGHDRRYAIDVIKIRLELGWQPRHDFETGLRRTVRWYLDNREWCEAVASGSYRRERLGVLPVHAADVETGAP